MKRFVTILAVLMAMTSGKAASAQTMSSVQLPRTDASASIGWFIGQEPSIGTYGSSSWYPDSGSRRLTGGYYWTEHLKTELGATWSGTGTLHGPHPDQTIDRQTNGYAEHLVDSRALTISQQYQFGHNARFHPYVAAGAGVEWARTTTELGPLYGPRGALVQGGRLLPPSTTRRGVATIGTGFKVYVTERAFMRTDLQIGFSRGRGDHVITSVGFGIDIL